MIYQLNVLLLLALSGLAGGPKMPATRETFEPVAVLELFTSQGCSSCPPADKLLTETLTEAAKTNRRVFGLSFHVDYWDRLGWRDPFSNHAFTIRQYQYGQQFKKNGVYTPQEVLNGRQEFVGSNRARQQTLLQTALQQRATAGVTLSLVAPANGKQTVTYHLRGDLTDAVLNVALVSKTAETSVPRGENAGRKLTHNNVVRDFKTIPASAAGTVTLTLPADFDSKNGAVVAYVQHKTTLAVRGAGQVEL